MPKFERWLEAWQDEMAKLWGSLVTQMYCVYIHKSHHICVYVCVYIHKCIHSFTHTYIHTYIHTYVHTHTHTHMHICTHIHVCCTCTQVTLETDSGQAARADGEAFMAGLWRTGVLTVDADKGDDDVDRPEGGPAHSQHKISRQQAREALRICAYVTCIRVYVYMWLWRICAYVS